MRSHNRRTFIKRHLISIFFLFSFLSSENCFKPPSRIGLPGQGMFEKKISDLSTRLTSSLRQSLNKKSDHDSNAETPSSSKKEEPEAHPSAVARTKHRTGRRGPVPPPKSNSRRATLDRLRHSIKKPLASSFTKRDKNVANAASAATPSAGADVANSGQNRKRRPQRKEISKAMSSLKMSVKKNFMSHHGDDSSSDDSDRNLDSTYRARRRAKPSPGRFSDVMKSMHKSIKGTLIGELSSCSEKSLSSSSDESNDDDNNPSNSSSEHNSNVDDSSSSPEKMIPQKSTKISHCHETHDVPQLKGSNQPPVFDRKSRKDSEITQTNNYLPQGLGDKPSRSSDEMPNAQARSGRARPPLTKGNSHRSMGSASIKSKSSRSLSNNSRTNSDFNASYPSSRSRRSNLDRDALHPPLHTKTSRNSSEHKKTSAETHRSKPKRRAPSSKKSPSTHRHPHNDKQRRTKRPPSLSHFKNSLSSSMSSLTRGKSYSDVAALALEEPPRTRPGQKSGYPRSERSSKGRGQSERSVHLGRHADVDPNGSRRGGQSHLGSERSSSNGRAQSERGLHRGVRGNPESNSSRHVTKAKSSHLGSERGSSNGKAQSERGLHRGARGNPESNRNRHGARAKSSHHVERRKTSKSPHCNERENTPSHTKDSRQSAKNKHRSKHKGGRSHRDTQVQRTPSEDGIGGESRDIQVLSHTKDSRQSAKNKHGSKRKGGRSHA